MKKKTMGGALNGANMEIVQGPDGTGEGWKFTGMSFQRGEGIIKEDRSNYGERHKHNGSDVGKEYKRGRILAPSLKWWGRLQPAAGGMREQERGKREHYKGKATWVRKEKKTFMLKGRGGDGCVSIWIPRLKGQ